MGLEAADKIREFTDKIREFTDKKGVIFVRTLDIMCPQTGQKTNDFCPRTCQQLSEKWTNLAGISIYIIQAAPNVRREKQQNCT